MDEIIEPALEVPEMPEKPVDVPEEDDDIDDGAVEEIGI